MRFCNSSLTVVSSSLVDCISSFDVASSSFVLCSSSFEDCSSSLALWSSSSALSFSSIVVCRYSLVDASSRSSTVMRCIACGDGASVSFARSATAVSFTGGAGTNSTRKQRLFDSGSWRGTTSNVTTRSFPFSWYVTSGLTRACVAVAS